jgi:large subunit ribosomal protein L18
MALTKDERRIRIKQRIRKKISGTQEKPRLTVFRSNKQFYAQLVNDITGITLVSVSSKDSSLKELTGNKTEQAKLVGTLAATKSKEAGISEVVFDRNGYLYHGRVKAFADAAREGGLKF